MLAKRIVLDTNVVVSAHLNGQGFERYVLDLGLAKKCQFYLSSEIVEEYKEVLKRPKFAFDPKQIARSIKLIVRESQMVEPKATVTVTTDPDDNKFLECAEAAQADYLITGNLRHFPKRWGRTLVVNAREFIELIATEFRQ